MYDDIYLFIQLVEIGSFSRAAKSLGIAQSTITKRIQSLEQNLNFKLFNRSTRTLNITDNGQELYNRFSNQVKSLNELLEEFCLSQNSNFTGTLRIGLSVTLAQTFIIRKINLFVKQYPGITVNIVFITSPVEFELLKDNFDILVSLIFPQDPNFEIEILTKLELKFYASPNYISRYSSPTSLADLNRHKLVGLSINGVTITRFLVANLITRQEIVFDYKAVIYHDDLLKSIALAKSDEFIICAPSLLVKDQLATQELCEILPDFRLKELPCYLIRRKNNQSKLEQAFSNFIKECFFNS